MQWKSRRSSSWKNLPGRGLAPGGGAGTCSSEQGLRSVVGGGCVASKTVVEAAGGEGGGGWWGWWWSVGVGLAGAGGARGAARPSP